MSDSRTQVDAERLDALATSQHGVVSRQQLRDLGLSDTMIGRWLHAGRLHRLHRQVFAVGHTALSIQGRLWAALLYAGPGSVLSHTTAAWIWSLIDAEPQRIHLTVPGRRPSLPEVRSHHSRLVERVDHGGFRVTPVARTLVDFASQASARQLRRALAEADFHGLLFPSDIRATLKSGRPGSAPLRAALRSHLPELAQTLSQLEERFLELCESEGLRLPGVNARVGRMRVDALWRDAGLAVELDGSAAHGGWAASKRDRQRELALRAQGFQVVRYTWEQVTRRPDAVVADLRQLLGL
jgi:very-short-patch-repair endonuclease